MFQNIVDKNEKKLKEKSKNHSRISLGIGLFKKMTNIIKHEENKEQIL